METWYYERNGQKVGPVSESQIKELVLSGELHGSSLVWTVGLDSWTALNRSSLASLLRAVPPDLPPSAAGIAHGTSANPSVDSAVSGAPQTSSANAADGDEVRDLQGLFGWLRFCMYAFVVTSAVYFLAIVGELLFFAALKNNSFASEEQKFAVASWVDALVRFTAMGVLITFVPSAIVYLRFVFRAMKNLHVTKAEAVTISPGWAVGWNFIPIAWFWKPLQVMREIWRGYYGLEAKAAVPGKIGWWWAFWLIMNITAYINLRLQVGSGSLSQTRSLNVDMYVAAIWFDVVSTLTGIFAAVIIVGILQKVVEAQRAELAASPA
jgi:Domain of unknown function (DUF4328)/GYF domain 2